MSPSPVARLIQALTVSPATLPELTAVLGYEPGVVLRTITAARAEGKTIRAVRDVTVAGVPARAQPEAGSMTTVYTLETP